MDIDNKESHQSGQSFSSSLSSSPNPSCSSHHKKRKAGRKKFRETRHPVYRGVRQRNGNKWVCEIREPIKKTRIWVGTYPTPEMAARAHDVAVLALSGTSTSPAKFNFPDSVSLLPSAKSCSAVDIRAAAAKATSTREASNSKGIGEKHDHETETVVFFDEEALYNMPALLVSMAEGLLITPPSTKTALDWDDVASQIDLTLWTN